LEQARLRAAKYIPDNTKKHSVPNQSLPFRGDFARLSWLKQAWGNTARLLRCSKWTLTHE
jgi:hypothetical protein